MDISHILNQLGEDTDRYFGAVVPPVVQSTNFKFHTVADLRAAFQTELDTHLYTRGNNPTVEILRKKIAALAGAEDSLVFSSGIAAISAAVLTLVKAGDHVVCVEKPYSWTRKLLTQVMPKFGVEATLIDGTNPENFKAAIQPNTRLIILESPNSFTFELQNLEEVVALAKSGDILTMIDNSYCTSLGQRCIEMGIDIEVHSASKYYGGHSDVVAGYLLSSKEIVRRIFVTGFQNIGAVISPYDAWLLIRGLRTLPIRLERIAKTTEAVVDFLSNHTRVEKVIYPFSKDFPQYELAKKQMKWCGGLFAAQIKVRDIDEVEKFCNNLKRFVMAVSWGGYESLIIPSCSFYPKESYNPSVFPYNLIRFYIGLEDADALISDLQEGFDTMNH